MGITHSLYFEQAINLVSVLTADNQVQRIKETLGISSLSPLPITQHHNPQQHMYVRTEIQENVVPLFTCVVSHYFH